MKKYKVWVECEKTIKAKNLDEAIKEFREQKLEMEFCGQEVE